MIRLLLFLLLAIEPAWAGIGRSPEHWDQRIDEIVNIQDPIEANTEITKAHYDLSVNLNGLIGNNSGANFHTWAVWGSFKARSSILGKDVPGANRIANAGEWIGCGTDTSSSLCLPFDELRRRLQTVTREISRGNRVVLSHIGRATARFLKMMIEEKSESSFNRFADTLHGDELLIKAFKNYYIAMMTVDFEMKQQHMLLGNLNAILREHHLLQPIIADAMPSLNRKLQTELFLTFHLGSEELKVGDDVPPVKGIYPASLRKIKLPELSAFLKQWDKSINTKNSRAQDWAKLEDRMNYICSLFRTRHLKTELFYFPKIR